MDYGTWSPTDATASLPNRLKVIVSGGFGVGKTTFIRSVSEIEPLETEELLTEFGSTTDRITGVERKESTTVAFDFGRRTLVRPRRTELMIFGTPGQERFHFTWDELTWGAAGIVVLADTRRMSDSWPSVNYFEKSGKPFIIAVNQFDGACMYEGGEVRAALKLPADVPIVLGDARDTTWALTTLVKLLEHAIAARNHLAPQGAA